MKTRQRERTKAIDWEDVRRRLACAQAASEESSRLTPAKAREVLEQRARDLARVPASEARAGEVIEVVLFALANETYAIEARYVQEVMRLTELTPLPGAPTFLAGVLNRRGEILGVLDLRTFLGVSGQVVTDLSRVLVLGGDRAEFGLLADVAHEVRNLRLDEILEPPGSLAGPGREYLRGVTQEALIVLDGAVLLQDGRLFIDQE